jgi:hypothetical protein
MNDAPLLKSYDFGISCRFLYLSFHNYFIFIPIFPEFWLVKPLVVKKEKKVNFHLLNAFVI